MRFPFAATILRATRRLTVQAANLLALAGLLAGLLVAASPAAGAAQPLPVQDVTTQDFTTRNFTAQDFTRHDFTDITNPRLSGGTRWAPPSPPTPQPRYALSFTRLQCVREGGGWLEQIAASDEPYVLIFAVGLRSPSSGRVVRTRVFGDVDSGESRSQSVPLWAGVLGDPDDLIVLVQIMEHDEGDVDHLARALDAGLGHAAVGLVDAGLGHNAIVSRLKAQMQLLINNNRVGQSHGSLNMDDQIGGIQELRITASDTAATIHGPVQKIIEANDSSDGRYRAFFELRRN